MIKIEKSIRLQLRKNVKHMFAIILFVIIILFRLFCMLLFFLNVRFYKSKKYRVIY